MLGVHLFLLKQLGCAAVEYGVMLPLKSFAVAILCSHSHPHVYLSFRISPPAPQGVNIVLGDLRVLTANNLAIGAQWFYSVGRLTVCVIYAERKRPDIEGLWHSDDEDFSPLVGKLARVVSTTQSRRWRQIQA